MVKQAELEDLLAAVCEKYAPGIIGNEYFFGTMERLWLFHELEAGVLLADCNILRKRIIAWLRELGVCVS